MPDNMTTTLATLQTQLDSMTTTSTTESANGASANARAAAAKRAAAQTQALLARTQAADAAADGKQKQITDADTAWKAKAGVAAPDVDGLGKTLAEALGVSVEDLQGGAAAVQRVDNAIQSLGSKQADALKKALDAQAKAAGERDAAAQALDDDIQALKDLTTQLAAQQKAAADGVGDAQKLAKATDPDSPYLAVVRYLALASQKDALAQTAADYKSKLDDANKAAATLKEKVAAAAAADAVVIAAQYDWEVATVDQPAKRATRDQDAIDAVRKALPKPKPKPAPTPAPAPAPVTA